MNVYGMEKKKKEGLEAFPRIMELFREVVNELQLCDLGYRGSVFTWTNRC